MKFSYVGTKWNYLASALFKISSQVAIEYEFTDLVLWSDSCVPQKRNSFIACAVQNFFHGIHSVPGNFCIQEVDNNHSLIEKEMKSKKCCSPLGVTQILKGVNHSHPIIGMIMIFMILARRQKTSTLK